MNFDSPLFLFCFLPALMLLHCFLRSTRARNWLLLACGLIFYSFGSLNGLLLLLASAAANYAFGLAIMNRRLRRPAFIIGVAANLAFLFAYKYLDFFLAGLSAAFVPVSAGAGLIAPAGISFFTFRSISYLADIYRGSDAGTRSFPRLLLYISFFPQLMAGPITRFADFAPQLESRSCSTGSMAAGLRRLSIGLGKKLLLASAMGEIADAVFSFAAPDIRLSWLGAIAYTLQIYFDFSGYSDMAIGTAQVFGFHTPENFNYPYAAASIADFWRRWHISLSSWFRDYLYIPLGGNRKGRARAAVNKFIVFTLCGLWHGAAWTFVLWGAWHGLLSALETLGAIAPKRMPKVIARAYTLLAVVLGFVLFRSESISSGLVLIGSMFSGFQLSTAGTVLLRSLLDPKGIIMLALAIVGCLPISPALRRLPVSGSAGRAASYALSIALLALCLLRLAAGGFSPFIYFQF